MSRQETLNQILKLVCNFYNMEVSKALERNRKREFVTVRQAFMYIARQHGANFGTHEIGQMIGLDHSSVIHGTKKVQGLIEVDADFAGIMAALKKQFILEFHQEFKLVENTRRTDRVNNLIDKLDFAEDEIKNLQAQLEAKNTELLSLISERSADLAELEHLRDEKKKFEEYKLKN
mgnify:FL=1